MKWKTKKTPNHNDERTVKKFAWLPKEIGDGTTVWLEYYLQKQLYHQGEYNWAGCVIERGWHNL